MLIHDEKSKLFIWRGGFESRHMPKSAGFKWLADRKVWATSSVYTAYQYAVAAGVGQLKQLLHIKYNICRSSAPDDKLCFRAYDKPYLPYQKAGIEHMVDQFRSGRKAVICADEQGLGKTVQAIGVANELGAKKLLIICPASLRLNWARELEKWHDHFDGVSVALTGKTKIDPNKSAVVSYSLVKLVSANEYDLVIIDELHYVKNGTAKRTKDVLKIAHKHLTVGLTGTPFPNGKPNELYPFLSACAPDTIDGMKYMPFIRRFCSYYEDGFGLKITGAKNERELMIRLRGSGLMTRRLKKDVLKDLPDKRYQMVVFPQDSETRKVIKKESVFDASEILEYGVPVGAGLPDLRREMGVAKVPACLSFINDLIESGVDKIGVFAHHIEVVEMLAEGLRGHGVRVITGSTHPQKRQKAVDDFQNDPTVKIFIGNEAAEEGLTLTAAHHVINAEQEWVPGKMAQREDRFHRIGQTKGVIVYDLVVEGSLDALIMGVSAEKREDAKNILNV